MRTSSLISPKTSWNHHIISYHNYRQTRFFWPGKTKFFWWGQVNLLIMQSRFCFTDVHLFYLVWFSLVYLFSLSLDICKRLSSETEFLCFVAYPSFGTMSVLQCLSSNLKTDLSEKSSKMGWAPSSAFCISLYNLGVNAHALSLVWFQVFCLIVAPCFFALEQLTKFLDTPQCSVSVSGCLCQCVYCLYWKWLNSEAPCNQENVWWVVCCLLLNSAFVGFREGVSGLGNWSDWCAIHLFECVSKAESTVENKEIKKSEWSSAFFGRKYNL